MAAAVSPRLYERYKQEVVPQLRADLGHKNRLAIPRLERIVVSMGVKEGASDIKVLEQAAQDLAFITGQKAKICRAKKSISAFKLRAGAPIGLQVTLRRARMYEFLDRLVSVAMPRIRDFRGIPLKSFDGRGNYSMGIQEQIIFPEVEYDKILKTQGMNITFVTTASNDEEARRLLELLGLPFRKKTV
jgi:large subunit ribosomal protein L5